MKNQNSNNQITFQQLIDAISKLQPEEKSKLIEILSSDKLSIVAESEAVYIKSAPLEFAFEERWNSGLNSEEFKEKVYQHIDTLPWK